MSSQDMPNAILPTDEVEFREIFIVLWQAKFAVAAITVLAAIFSIVYSLNLPNIYTSSTLLAPKSGGEGVNRIAGQYAGLASLAGIDLRGGGTNTVISIQTMKSRHFFRHYLYESILVELVAVRSWQPDSNELVIDSTIYDEVGEQWVRSADYPTKSKPSVQEAFSAFSSAMTVSEDQQTGFVTVSVEHLSPIVAKRWVDLMVNGINEAIRERAIEEAKRSIEYLTAQVERTALVNLDEIFSELIEEQTKTLMLANVSKDYVFQVIDPPVVSELKAKPKRGLICTVGTILGGVLAVLIVLVYHFGLRRIDGDWQ